MSNSNLARRTEAQVVFDGVDISEAISEYLLSISYTDNEEDEADDLQIKLHDRDDVWLLDYLNSVIDAAGAGTSNGDYSKGVMVYKIKSSKKVALRAGPGTSYPTLGKLSNGKKVVVFEVVDEWARTTYGERTAYVMTKYLKKGTAATAAQVEKSENVVKGLSISASFNCINWNGDGEDDVLECGDFELDDVDASGPPATITIKATGLSYSSGLRQTKKSRAWENITLSGIANKMAEANDLACLFESTDDPKYKRVEQAKMSDIEFLGNLCRKAGLALKTINNTIIIFDQAEYESQEPILTIPHGSAGGYSKYKLSNGKADTSYAACHVSYATPGKKGKIIQAMAYAEGYQKSDENQVLEVTAVVTSVAEAENLARKMLRLHNKFGIAGSFTFPGNTRLISGMTVELPDWGMYSGKFIICQAKHTLSRSGYSTTIDIRHVLEEGDTVRIGEKYKVSASSTAVRSGPSTKNKKVGTLKKNAIVYIISQEGKWGTITYKEKTSYAYMKHYKRA